MGNPYWHGQWHPIFSPDTCSLHHIIQKRDTDSNYCIISRCTINTTLSTTSQCDFCTSFIHYLHDYFRIWITDDAYQHPDIIIHFILESPSSSPPLKHQRMIAWNDERWITKHILLHVIVLRKSDWSSWKKRRRKMICHEIFPWREVKIKEINISSAFRDYY